MLENFRRRLDDRPKDLEFSLVDVIRKEVGTHKNIDWDGYKKSLEDLLYEAVIKKNSKNKEELCLQIRQFDELRLRHERHLLNEMNWSGISPEEKLEIKGQIRIELNGRDDATAGDVFKSVEILMKDGMPKADAVRQAVMAYKQDDITLKD